VNAEAASTPPGNATGDVYCRRARAEDAGSAASGSGSAAASDEPYVMSDEAKQELARMQQAAADWHRP